MPTEPTTEEISTAARLKAIEDALSDGKRRMDAFETELKDNTTATLANTELTTEIRDILMAAKLGLKAIGAIGSIAKWLGLIATAGVAIYTAIYAMTHGGATPPSPP